MTITILTLFPEMFERIISTSILGRAQKKGLVKIRLVNLRNWAIDKRGTVDDRPYGGGVGMLLRVDVVEKAIQKSEIKNQKSKIKQKIVLLDPAGKEFNQTKAQQYVKLDHLMLVSGHYEGIDSRIENFVDESLSIGKYVLTGGELPAMVVTDTVTRLIPGVLKKGEAVINESYTKRGKLEALQYTRPPVYKGLKVPQVLLLGNHQEIAKWRKASSLNRGK